MRSTGFARASLAKQQSRSWLRTVEKDGNAASKAYDHSELACLCFHDDDVCQTLAAASTLDEASHAAQEPVSSSMHIKRRDTQTYACIHFTKSVEEPPGPQMLRVLYSQQLSDE